MIKKFFISLGILITLILISLIIINIWIFPDGKLDLNDFYFENSQTKVIKGYKLHYQMDGEKDIPVLLLPDYGNSSFSYRNNIDELTKNFTIYALDTPPFGLSQKEKSKEYSEEKVVGLIKAFMDSIETDRSFNLVAHGGGGRLAIALAARYPKKIGSLVLINSYGLENPNGLINSVYAIPFFGKAIFKTKLHLIPGRRMIIANYKDPLKLTPGEKEILFQSQRLKGYYNSYIEYNLNPRINVPKEIGSLDVPVLIIWGKDDPFLSVNTAEKLKVRIKDAELVLINGSAHVPHEEKPDEVNLRIIEFIQINSAK